MENPEGIPSRSQGLARSAYPGDTMERTTTPTGLRPIPGLPLFCLRNGTPSFIRKWASSGNLSVQGWGFRVGDRPGILPLTRVSYRNGTRLVGKPHCLLLWVSGATPMGLNRVPPFTQGSSFLTTLGFEAKSLRDLPNGNVQTPGAPPILQPERASRCSGTGVPAQRHSDTPGSPNAEAV